MEMKITQVRPEDFMWVHYLKVHNRLGSEEYEIEFVEARWVRTVETDLERRYTPGNFLMVSNLG